MVHYAFYLDTEQNFSSPSIVSGLMDTTYTLSDSLVQLTTYFWKVVAYDRDSLATPSREVFSFTVGSITEVSESEPRDVPEVFALSQNYPNPFNPITIIKYQLPKDSHVTLMIFNLLGQQVETLVDKQQEAGYYSVRWNAANVASGLYFYWLKAGRTSHDKSESEFSQVRKMII